MSCKNTHTHLRVMTDLYWTRRMLGPKYMRASPFIVSMVSFDGPPCIILRRLMSVLSSQVTVQFDAGSFHPKRSFLTVQSLWQH